MKKVCVFIIIFVLFASVKGIAQCNDVKLNLTEVRGTCVSDAMIIVKLSGADTANIEKATMQFRVTGGVDWGWSHYGDNTEWNHNADTIKNLPAATTPATTSYTVQLRALCETSNQWQVFNQTATINLTTDYSYSSSYLGPVIKTLNCIQSGRIPVIIRRNTGPLSSSTNPSNYHITLTSYPSSYLGPYSFDTLRLNRNNDLIYNIDGLPEGDYTVSVTDKCSFTEVFTAHVGKMTQDFVSDIFYYRFHATTNISLDCRDVGIYKNNRSDRTPDEQFYFYTNLDKYFQLGMRLFINGVPQGTGIDWIPSDSLAKTKFTYQMAESIKAFREGNPNHTYAAYLRIKGTTDPACQHQLQDFTSIDPYFYQSFGDITCNDYTLRMNPYSDYDGFFCFPYRYRFIYSSSAATATPPHTPGDVIFPFTNWIYDRGTDTIYHVPWDATIEYETMEGQKWSRILYSHTNKPAPLITNSGNYCQSNGMTGDTIHQYIQIYMSSVDSFPAGTRIQFISGPLTPIHADTTFTKNTRAYYHPYSVNTTTSTYMYLPRGRYTFEMTLPGCDPQQFYRDVAAYFVKTHFSYTTKETCNGIAVIPTAGQLAQKAVNGTVTDINTYFYLYDMNPTVTMFRGPVTLNSTDTIFLSVTGKYTFQMMNYNDLNSCGASVTTINYTKPEFRLNPDSSTAYVCREGGAGYIRVKGMGGVLPYTYELFDNGVSKGVNNTGIFHYGVAGKNYTIRLKDACGTAYDQEVPMIDLGIAHIIHSNNSYDAFCKTDSIELHCVTLGETTYTWKGRGIPSSKQHLQHLKVYAGDFREGRDTVVIQVTPEGCGEEVSDTIFLTIENCSGAHNDYLAMLENTTDSINISLNDSFPNLACQNGMPPGAPLWVAGPSHHIASPPFTWTPPVIHYTPAPNFVGRDSITYRVIHCRGIDTAKVYISVMEKPDNISDDDCFAKPPTFTWDIREAFKSTQADLATYTSPVVGDLDGDGIPEILVAKHYNTGAQQGYTDGRSYNGVYIYWGHNRQTPTFVNMKEGYYVGQGFSIARIPIGGVVRPVIVTAGYFDGHLYAYDPDPAKTTEAASRVWQSDSTLRLYGDFYASSIGFVDFDNDGEVEIYTGNQIFDAATGVMLAEAGTGANSGASRTLDYKFHFPFAADVTGDGNPEYLAGTQAYSVNINSRTDCKQNSMTLVASVPDIHITGTLYMKDGATTVADINRDGRLDIIVTAALNTTTYGLAAWDVQTQSVIATGYGTTESWENGMPFIGNVDTDPNLEILIVSYNKLRGYRWNGAQSFTQIYNRDVVDASGSTGITLFDFNQDNVAELIYRDESDLRIMKASGATFTDITTPFPAISGTGLEHPVVADVDNDGQAEIVTVGGTASSNQGTMRIYKAGTNTKWAPARKVWNQYAYNAVNVNDDLTIPRYQLNPATKFPPTSIQPYNNFMQQQTKLSIAGTPIWPLPDAELINVARDYDPRADTARYYVTFTNKGSAAFQPPFYISVSYQGIHGLMSKYTDSVMYAINPGDTVSVEFMSSSSLNYPRPSLWPFKAGFTKYDSDIYPYLALNSLNSMNNFTHPAAFEQPECDYGNNFQEMSRAYGLYDDAATVQEYKWVTIDALGADSLPPGYPEGAFSLLDSVVSWPRNGTLHVEGTGINSKFIYVNTGTDSLNVPFLTFSPHIPFTIDTFTYRLTYRHPDLGIKRHTAKVWIAILEGRGTSACYSDPDHTIRLASHLTVGMNDTTHYLWYNIADEPYESQGGVPVHEGAVYNPGPLTADVSWWIRPGFNGSGVPPQGVNPHATVRHFPPAPFTVHVDAPGDVPPMRWTGDNSHKWNDPQNWVIRRKVGGMIHEFASDREPSACTDVEIPTAAGRFP
ncbi:MAG: FG-GAP-like repeat-containing protein, partial [Tannerella sp.]|nr:FG-GAP-like repeat-containing protein [Tannerella sp.]